jgi:hypothetical protein
MTLVRTLAHSHLEQLDWSVLLTWTTVTTLALHHLVIASLVQL